MVSQQQGSIARTRAARGLEQDHHGRPSFRVVGKIFATLWDEDHMNVMLDEAGILTAAQCEPETCTECWWGKRLGALHVNLSRVDPDRLTDLLTRRLGVQGAAERGGQHCCAEARAGASDLAPHILRKDEKEQA